jgi:site-specific DNA recombinase
MDLSGKRVAVYARFSSAMQSEHSIDDQVHACRRFISSHGGRLDDSLIASDYATSGTVFARAGLEQVMGWITGHKIDALIVWNTSRLSRDVGDSDRLWKLLSFNGVQLLGVSDGLDSSSRGSRFTYSIKSVIDDHAIEVISENTLNGLRGQANKGLATGGLPFGYESKHGGELKRERPRGFEIVINEEQAAVVRRIFSLYLEGRSLGRIAEILNEEAVDPPRGSRTQKAFWRKGTLREMLRNEAYVGRWVYGERKWAKDPITRKRQPRKRDESEIQRFDRPHLAIVDQALWTGVQDRLSKATIKSGTRSSIRSSSVRALSGLLTCGSCGSVMVRVGGSGGVGSVYYRCSAAHSGTGCSNKRGVREDAVLSVVTSELTRVLTTTGVRDLLQQRIQARLEKYKVEVATKSPDLKKRLEKLKGEIAKMVGFIRVADPTAALAVMDELKEATQQKLTLEAQLKETEGNATETGPRVPSVEELTALATDVAGRLVQDPASGREMLRRLLGGTSIEVSAQDDGSHAIRGAVFPMAFLEPLRPRNEKAPRVSGGFSKSVDLLCCADRI